MSRDISSGVYTTDDRDQKYTYDGLLRLAQANSGTLSGGNITDANADFRQKWTLDQLGNWTDFQQDGEFDYGNTANNGFGDNHDLDQDRTHNDVNELTGFSEGGSQAAWVDPAYDDAGNMTEGPSPADPTVKHKYVYDAWNRLVEVTDASDVFIQENEYDGLNRRIVKIDKDADPDVTYDYYYNEEWQVLEIHEDGDATYPWKQYVYHPLYVDAVAIRFYDENTDGDMLDPNEGEHTYLYDANFNVTAVGLSSGVVERYDYTAYGEVIVMEEDFTLVTGNTSAIGNEYLYTGRRLDPETGLQQSRHRYYHAQLGRWTQQDMIEYADSYNMYEYVDSSPTNFLDPTGFCTITLKTKPSKEKRGNMLGKQFTVAEVIVTFNKGCETPTKPYINVSVEKKTHPRWEHIQPLGGFGPKIPWTNVGFWMDLHIRFERTKDESSSWPCETRKGSVSYRKICYKITSLWYIRAAIGGVGTGLRHEKILNETEGCCEAEQACCDECE